MSSLVGMSVSHDVTMTLFRGGLTVVIDSHDFGHLTCDGKYSFVFQEFSIPQALEQKVSLKYDHLDR